MSDAEELDDLIKEITAKDRSDDEANLAFLAALRKALTFPIDAHVFDVPVECISLDYDGNARRGITASCRHKGKQQLISLADLEFSNQMPGVKIVAAYRKWLGILPLPGNALHQESRKNRHKAEVSDFEMDQPLDLVVFSVSARVVRSRILKTSRALTLKSADAWDRVPGEILTVVPKRFWTYARHPYLSGEILRTRRDASELGLEPLRLEPHGAWDPTKDSWAESDHPIDECLKPVLLAGPRPCFEMEPIPFGGDPFDPFDDPILEAVALKDQGEVSEASELLTGLLTEDLRHLEAHAHLGNFAFDGDPEKALRHYEMGVRIGALSLPDGFIGILLWGCIGNRPFLRCLHGYGLCLWRTGRAQEALKVFERILWLSPQDNQGVRFLIPDVRSGAPWADDAVV